MLEIISIISPFPVVKFKVASAIKDCYPKQEEISV